MKPMKVWSTLLIVFASLFLLFSSVSYAETKEESAKRLDDIQKQINDTQAKINDLQGQEKTLSSQIGVINNQIKLTELKIDSTQAQISDLILDIDTANKKIDKLEGSLDKLSEVLLNRIKATYVIGSNSGFQSLMASNSVSDFVQRANYLRIAQEHDKKLIYDTVQAKNDYSNQKEIYEDKKATVEKLKKDLETYNSQLDKDRASKEQLLSVTKNDEAQFQSLLSRLKADAASINQALGNIGAKIGPVNKGDVIASVGSSGCSTGPHLHLEVYTNAKVENGRVVGNRTDPKPYLENSSYQQPVPGFPGSVTTWYGEVYFLGTHTGIDISNSYGTPIRAMDSGEAYATSAMCSYNGSLGKGVIVDHKNGMVTLYWHIP